MNRGLFSRFLHGRQYLKARSPFVVPRMARVNQRCQDLAQTQRHIVHGASRSKPTTSTSRRWTLHRPIYLSSEVVSPGERESDLAELTIPTTAMAKSFGSGGAATLQRSKLSLKKEVRQVDPKTDDSGGGGNIGKIIHNGGGGGGDDDDDDDYFFDDGGEDGDGDGDKFFGKGLPQLYDKISVGAVLSEWYRTVADMPVILRRAIEMGLFSSAQLVRFLSMDVRPNATRAVQRSLPVSISRAFIGRLMADPAFCHKLVIENILACCGSLYYEMKIRGNQFKKEWDLALINTLGVMVTTSSVVWMLTPSRSFGAVNKLPWQELMGSLPNNVFDASGPMRKYTTQMRIFSLFTKTLELAFVGACAGLMTTAATNLTIQAHKSFNEDYKPSYEPKAFDRSAIGMSLFYGLHAHFRYQLLGGIDRYFFEHSNFLWTYFTTSGLCRIANAYLAEAHRPHFAGLPTKPVYSPQSLSLPYMKKSQSSLYKRSPSSESPRKPKVKKTKGFELSMSS